MWNLSWKRISTPHNLALRNPMTFRTISLLLPRFALLLWLSFASIKVLSAGESRSALSDPEIKIMLRDYIDSDKLGVGLAVGIVDDHGRQVISHGKLGNGTDGDVDDDTLFHIGSITKVFTALLLQDMVERREMKLNDPVQKYLPDSVRLPTFQGKEITLPRLTARRTLMRPISSAQALCVPRRTTSSDLSRLTWA
jgi:CubicO group peptidase (beta-lactamase class C family)